jgi:hypothetical protein
MNQFACKCCGLSMAESSPGNPNSCRACTERTEDLAAEMPAQGRATHAGVLPTGQTMALQQAVLTPCSRQADHFTLAESGESLGPVIPIRALPGLPLCQTNCTTIVWLFPIEGERVPVRALHSSRRINQKNQPSDMYGI